MSRTAAEVAALGAKRKRMSTIRALPWNAPIPEGEPRRYRNSSGYVRLRWLVGPQQYVEEYEHRINAGRPHPRLHVHHINGVKDDNRPENLEVLTAEQHGLKHEQLKRAADPERGNRFGGHRSAQAQAKAERRKAREAEMKQRGRDMKALYEEGLSTVEIGARFGLHPSNVSRHLRSAGALMNARNEADAELAKGRAIVHKRSGMRCERCGTNLKWDGGDVHHRKLRQTGATLTPDIHRPDNLAHLCRPCHGWAHHNRTEAKRTGWIVPPWGDPESVPLETLHHTLLMLHRDGSVTSDSLHIPEWSER